MTTTPRDVEAEPVTAGELAPILHPATGEVLELAGANAPRLLDELTELERLETAIRDYRASIESELIGRVDAHGARTVELDGCKLEVNAPTEDLYDPADVRRELEPLVKAGKVPAATLDALIVQPPPPKPEIPPERVDKRRVNGLKSSDNRELLAALARARRRAPKRRTVKVLGRPVEGTAEEV